MSIPHVAIVTLRHQDLYWIHQRHASKRVYPGLWGIGIGGKVDANESPLQAAVRELQEESGIQVVPEALRFLGEYDWNTPEATYHGFLFLLETTPEKIQPCAREFQDFKWVTATEIEQQKMSGQLCPDTAYFYEKMRITSFPIPSE